MKKIIFLKLFVFVLSAAFAFTGSWCKDEPSRPPDEEEKCGESFQWFKAYNGDQFRAHFSNISETTVHYEDVEGSPENICPDEHLTVKFKVMLTGTKLPDNWVVKAVAYYVLREKVIDMVFDSNSEEYTGSLYFGIRDGYQEGKPGWLGLQVRITLPASGTVDDDLKLVRENISKVQLECDYKIFKPK